MAKLSNSSLSSFFVCPVYYSNRYVEGLTKVVVPEYLKYGSRMHQLLQAHHSGMAAPPQPPDLSQSLENEAQAMIVAYRAAYPTEEFDVLETERLFEQIVPPMHTYIGRVDALLRERATGKLLVMEHKTENRGSKRNLPASWTARSQASLYAWAASEIYGEPIDTVLLNVLTRGSPGKQIGPSFRRDRLVRTPLQIQKALASFRWVADRVDEGVFVENTNSCASERGFNCDYWNLCHTGRDAGTLSEFVEIEPYAYLGTV